MSKSVEKRREDRLAIIERSSWPAKFKRLSRTGILHYNDDDNYCSVLALALAAEVSYGKAYGALKRAGRKHGGGVREHMILDAAEELGLFLGPAEWKCQSVRKTINELNDEGTKKALVFLKGHVFVVKAGVMYDHGTARRKVEFIRRIG